MLSYTRSVLSRVASSSTKKAPSAASRGLVSRSGRSLASKAISGSQSRSLSKTAIVKYSSNPYLNVRSLLYRIVKAETGPLNSMDMIAQVPPIVVPGKTATCDGGDGPLGHPKIYISLNLASMEEPAHCEYCGLRFISTDYLQKELKSGKHYERGTHFLEPADLPDWEYNAAHSGGGHH